MKSSLIWIGWVVGMTTASYDGNFGSDTEVLLRARAIPRLFVRTNGNQRGHSRGQQRQARPEAGIYAEGPAKVFKSGPKSKSAYVPDSTQAQFVSEKTEKPYVDGRLLGEAPPYADHQSHTKHPLRAASSGQKATVQVSVPPKGRGFLKTANADGEIRSSWVQGGTEKKMHVESDTPGGAEAFASVTRPGRVNADAQR